MKQEQNEEVVSEHEWTNGEYDTQWRIHYLGAAENLDLSSDFRAKDVVQKEIELLPPDQKYNTNIL